MPVYLSGNKELTVKLQKGRLIFIGKRLYFDEFMTGVKNVRKVEDLKINITE